MSSTAKHLHGRVRRPALIILVGALPLSGCGQGGQEVFPRQPDAGKAVEPSWSVVDTSTWECGGNGGTLGVLLVDGSYADTVDLSFGVHALTGGLFFVPMETFEEPVVGAMSCPSDPVFFDGTERTALEDLLPLFLPERSNPTSLRDAVLYWGFRGSRIYAVRFDLAAGEADTTLLTDDPRELQHGNRYHFDPPSLRDREIVFSTWSGRVFVLDEDLVLLSDSVISR